jgi:hypothetical protein
MSLYLREQLTFDQARVQVLHEGKDGKDLYMKGICIQGGIKNANARVYPVNEIQKAVKTLNDQITSGYSVLGEVDHPDDLKINVDGRSKWIWQNENFADTYGQSCFNDVGIRCEIRR